MNALTVEPNETSIATGIAILFELSLLVEKSVKVAKFTSHTIRFNPGG
jgi:hypothetical protein